MFNAIGRGKELPWNNPHKGLKEYDDRLVFAHLIPSSAEMAEFQSRHRQVIIPIRHPEAFAKRWLFDSGFKGTWDQHWRLMSPYVETAFFFPWETSPWDELESLIGEVDRSPVRIGHKTPEDFPLPESEQSKVAAILAEDPVARRFYDPQS